MMTKKDIDKDVSAQSMAQSMAQSIAAKIRLHDAFKTMDEEEIDELADEDDLNSFIESFSDMNTIVSELTSDQKNLLTNTIGAWATNHDEIEARASVAKILKLKRTSARDVKDAALGTLEACKRRDSIHIVRSKARKAPKSFGRSQLASLIMTKKFMLYRHRYASAQVNRTFIFPTLPQPKFDEDLDEDGVTEMTRTRTSHRFIITADTQFGILMDGFEMRFPNWQTEIDISRQCVKEINAMKAEKRPLYVCVCGDLIDTEGSFSNALASWKQVMMRWERHVIAKQQMKDWKDVWSHLDEDIGLVCLCGNHDVGNRPTTQSIQTWTSAFGNDYLAFWVNGTYNIGLNNCVFSNPSGAMDLYEEQLAWLEGRLEYASAKNASQIFVYSHFPWFIKHEDECDLTLTSASFPPKGWGPQGSQFADSYFNIPKERRKRVLSLFRKHKVKACFSGHFHQNVISKTDWGMDMIITGPLSMTLTSTDQLSMGEEKQTIGMRVVDVQENSFQHEFIPLKKHLYCVDCKETKPDQNEIKPKATPSPD